MNKELGISNGWAFPISVDIYGGIKLSSDEQNIEESIKIILETSLGEMISEPNFGSRLSSLMFAPCTVSTIRMAEEYVFTALRKFEPRISVKSVKGVKNPDIPTAVDLQIDYDIPYLRASEKTSYQFSVEGDE